MIWTVSARIRSERSPRSDVRVGGRARLGGVGAPRCGCRGAGAWAGGRPRDRRRAGPCGRPGPARRCGSSSTAGASGARRPSASGRARRRKRWPRSASGSVGSSDVSAAMRSSASSGMSTSSPRSARSPWRRTAAAATTAVRSPLPPLASRPSIQAAATMRSSTSAGMVGNHSPATLRRRMRPRRSARVSVSPITPPRIPRTLALFAGLACRFPRGGGKGTHRTAGLPPVEGPGSPSRPANLPGRLGFGTASSVVISRHANGVLSLRGGKRHRWGSFRGEVQVQSAQCRTRTSSPLGSSQRCSSGMSALR